MNDSHTAPQPSEAAERVAPEHVVAKVLKRLYPQNPDIVLGREARRIVEALREEGLLPDAQ